ncbi:MAG: efflux RND transporter periplasmic adaptor subunit [Acidobacteriota bacterium]
MKKFLIISGVVVGLAALVWFSRGRSGKGALEVETEMVERRDLTSVVEASGQIEPAVSVDISSDVIGKIIALGVEEGDEVEKGQFLVQIDPVQYEQRVARLEAEKAATTTSAQESEANLQIRKADYDRDRRLYDEKLIPLNRFQATEATYRMAQAQLLSAKNRIQQAEASLNEARDQLGRCRILSPMDGVVIRKNAEVGEVAISGTLNNQGSLLLTIADLSVMKTEVDVDETDVVDGAVGQDVSVSLDAFPSREFKGKVTRIANSAIQTASAPGQRQSADYKVEVTLLESDPKIRPGLSATARITTSRREGVPSVPIQALVVREADDQKSEEPSRALSGGTGVAMAASRAPSPGAPSSGGKSGEPEEKSAPPEKEKEKKNKEVEGVFVVRDGKAVFVPVETGIAGEKYFEVASGLRVGDQVVSGNFAALRKLKDGDAVSVKEADSPSSGG